MAEKKSWQEWKTTIFGVLSLVGGILVALGQITPEQSADLTANLTSLSEVITGGVMAIGGIITIFPAK